MKKNILEKQIIFTACIDSFKKLHPKLMIKNPVMFLTYIGAILTLLHSIFIQTDSFNIQITIWLWFTVIFANFSESLAEGRGKAQAMSLKKNKKDTIARLLKNESETQILAQDLKKSDIVICETGDLIPNDGEIIKGMATIDESAITGESAPVIRESGGDRSAVTGGTKVLSDKILIKITVDPGHSFIDRMIALVESSQRQKTPNEIALTILLSGLSIIFLVAIVTLKIYATFISNEVHQSLDHIVTLPVLISLLVCLIPTTIGGLLSAIGISGMDRLIQKNVIATSGRAVEAAGDIDVLMLDKTGTITYGNRMASQLYPINTYDKSELSKMARIASLGDETPEGKSIVTLAEELYPLISKHIEENGLMEFIPFTAETRMSGVNFQKDGIQYEIRKGAYDSIKKLTISHGHEFPIDLTKQVEIIAKNGGTPLVVSLNNKATSTEFDILKILIMNVGNVVTHRSLLKSIWGPNSVEHTQYLRVYVGHLRKKLLEIGLPEDIIITETGIGYRLQLLQ